MTVMYYWVMCCFPMLLPILRYFVLDAEQGQLHYFVNEQSQKARGTLPLSGASVVPHDELPHMFCIYATNGEIFKLRGKNRGRNGVCVRVYAIFTCWFKIYHPSNLLCCVHLHLTWPGFLSLGSGWIPFFHCYDRLYCHLHCFFFKWPAASTASSLFRFHLQGCFSLCSLIHHPHLLLRVTFLSSQFKGIPSLLHLSSPAQVLSLLILSFYLSLPQVLHLSLIAYFAVGGRLSVLIGVFKQHSVIDGCELTQGGLGQHQIYISEWGSLQRLGSEVRLERRHGSTFADRGGLGRG